MWYHLAGKLTYSHHLSVRERIGYFKEKLHLNHFWELKGLKDPVKIKTHKLWTVRHDS